MADKKDNEYEYSTSNEENSIDIEGIVADFRRYSRLFAVVFVSVFVVVFALNISQKAKFTSSASIMISNEGSRFVPGQQTNPDQSIDSTVVDSEVELIRSTAVAERVASELKLDRDPEFNPALRKKDGIKDQIKSLFSSGDAPQTVLDQQLNHQVVINNVLSGLSVKRVGLTRLINVNYTSGTKERAALMASTWATAYLEEKVESKSGATKDTSTWLSGRIDELRGQVEAAERAVQEYKIANNLLSASGATLTEQEISDYNRQLAGAKVEQAAAEARLNTARSQLQAGSNGEDVGEALSSNVVSTLRVQSADVSRRLADLQSRYGPRHPDVVRAQNELTDINQQINNEISRIISNLEAQVQIQRQRTASLQRNISATTGQLVSNNKAMVKLRELELNAQSVRSLYESYLDRFKQSSAQEGIQVTNATIVANAKVPTAPSSPSMTLALLFGFAGGLLTGGSAVLIRRAFDTGVTTGQDVEHRLGVPYLTGISSLESTLEDSSLSGVEPHKYIVLKPLSIFAEGFRSLRAAVMYSSPGKENKIIAVTSALPGEGKTITSICLGITMALAGQRVVVVDCDTRRRSLMALFRDKHIEKGLIEVLEGKATLEEVMLQDEQTGLKLLPIAPHSQVVKDIFGSEAMDRVLAELRENYDMVVLDTAPVLPVVDTRILARKADTVVMLVRWRHTPRKASQAALELLKDVQANIAGVALTQINIKDQARYGYGDSGYYYRAYKSYYSDN